MSDGSEGSGAGQTLDALPPAAGGPGPSWVGGRGEADLTEGMQHNRQGPSPSGSWLSIMLSRRLGRVLE